MSSSSARSVRQPSEAASALQAIVDGLAKRSEIPHVVLHVSQLDGSDSWSGAAGQADGSGRAMTAETPYFIASIDKIYNAAVIHMLVESGELGLATKLVEVLPDEMVRGIHVLDGRDYTPEITIEHLLSHSSGLPDHLEDRRGTNQSVVEELVGSGQDRYLNPAESLAIVRDEMTPHFAPQNLATGKAKIRYSDTNFVLLMEVIAAVTGRSVREVVTEKIFIPAGLTSTYYLGAGEPASGAPVGAALWSGDDALGVPLLLESMRSIYSTAADQASSLRFLHSGECFTNPETRDRMFGSWRRFGFPTDVASLRAPSWPIEYGLGAMRFAPAPAFTGFKRRPAVVGHTGSTGTWLFACEELNVVFSGAVDQVTAGPVPFRVAIPSVLKALMS